MIYCPACQPHHANRGFIPVLCTACTDRLEAICARALARRVAEGDQAAIALEAADRRENARKDKL